MKVEERGRGSRKRRDLTIYDRQNKIVLTGEVKMPDSPEGRSPYQEALVMDAHDKANRIGVEHFFTWNVNKCVLWKTFEKGKPITERYEEELDAFASPIRTSAELKHPRVKDQLNRFITRLLERCTALVTGAEPLRLFPLDDKFIRMWEAGLLPLVTDTLHAINDRYDKDRAFKTRLNRWMRDDQGWTLSDDEDILRDNLDLLPHNLTSEGMLNIVLAVLLTLAQIGVAYKWRVDDQGESERRERARDEMLDAVVSAVRELKENQSEEVGKPYRLERATAVFSRPGPKRPRVGYVYAGQRVRAVATTGRWIFIEYADPFNLELRAGWIRKKYASLER